VEITNGNLKRINPLNLAEKFSGIIENESIATNCQAKMIMHPGLKFHDSVAAAQMDLDEIQRKKEEAEKAESAVESIMDSIPESASNVKPDDNTADTTASTTTTDQNDETKTADNDAVQDPQGANGDDAVASDSKADKLNEGRSIYTVSQSVKDCGNVFEGSRIFFEYVIDKEKRSEFQNLKALPFQVQIEYQKKDGAKMLRVISQMKAVTMDKKSVRNNLDFDMLGRHGTHVTTELCAKGDYESSRMWTASNVNFMQRNCNHRSQALAMANYAQENVALDHQMQRQLVTESIQHYEEEDGGDWADFAAPRGSGAAALTTSALRSQSAKSSYFGGGKKSKKGKMSRSKKKKERKSARNDVFSSQMYQMKSKK